ncbi:MAG TPA: DUF1405 domain-containing protein [Roseiflexaceae bacterium]|nr:DUF1405 domain-containing protein [Roseiflexaceae bacterium]HMP40225.1 DUF1405 domain-containing protein [Roseiflexaceae bacterium]
MLRLLHGTLAFILRNPLIFWACVIANLLGAVIGGIFWYGPMIMASPIWALPFIPDCPLAALLGSIALLMIRSGRVQPFFIALTAFACIKYGAWTLFFWGRQWSGSGVILPVELLLFITHIGLLCEGVLFVPRIGRLSLNGRLGVIGIFVLSIVVDYGFGFHPPLVSHVGLHDIFWAATILTTLLGVGLLALPRTSYTAAPQPKPLHGI